MLTLKNKYSLSRFAILLSVVNFLLFHLPFFRYVFNNVDYKSTGGIIIIISLIVLMLIVNAFVFYILFYLSRRVGKVLMTILFICSAIAVYFVNTYGTIVDEDMMGNVFNTKYEEASSFFSFKLILYILVLGVLPSIFIIKAAIEKVSFKKFIITTLVTLIAMAVLAFANSVNWLWIDKNSKQLGGLAMPWSYSVNTALLYVHKSQENRKEILLPNATITDSSKSVVVLVIGESARSENFSLYGYKKNTNSLLSQTPNVYHFNTTSCATYTTAGVKCILEHENTDDLYETLPNYLYRNNVDVIWRSTNWGEPPLHIPTVQHRENLQPNCKGEGCEFDEVLLTGLTEQILSSKKNKILVILHTSTSHGPTYSKKYPTRFQVFTPVCNSVELAKCSQTELINAYDNTIVYTDYILHSIIDSLKQLNGYKASMLFVSDHGESLGEKNLYMHGVPMSIAPKEQYDIPFIVWVSDHSKELKANNALTQNHVFHSVLNFLGIQSPVYKEELNIFK